MASRTTKGTATTTTSKTGSKTAARKPKVDDNNKKKVAVKEKPAKKEEAENGEEDAEEMEGAPEPKVFNAEVWLSYGKAGDSPNSKPDREIDNLDIVPINEGHKAVIRETWGLMNNHLTESGTRIFLRIFEVNSRIKTVFGFSDGDTTDYIAHNDRLQMHAKRFMQAVEYSVEHLDELDPLVSEVFVNLGKRHIYFQGLDPDYFGVFSGAMMYVWRDDLGDHFTPEIREAWSRLFDFLLQHLRHGLELAIEASQQKKKKK